MARDPALDRRRDWRRAETDKAYAGCRHWATARRARFVAAVAALTRARPPPSMHRIAAALAAATAGNDAIPMKKPTSTNPWDWMQPHDIARFGVVIGDPKEQERWCRAVMLGGLPYMWNKAGVVREMIYDKLALRAGDKVLVIGESLESCGFIDDINARIGPAGELRAIDITDEARDNYFAGKRGRGGQLATWQWTYTSEIPDGRFDCAAVLQAVQHTDDWTETGQELLRVMKPGRNVVLAEITYGPEFTMLAQLDMHLEYLIEKVFRASASGLRIFPITARRTWSGRSPTCVDPGTFLWKGIELFWGTKP
jgi:hypothetical protein